jgi:hypothetical protein
MNKDAVMERAWEDCRRRGQWLRRALLLALAWIVPGSLLRRWLVGLGWEDEAAFLLVGFSPMALILVAHVWRMLWPCPRCGRSYRMTWYYGNPFTTSCLHCDLPLEMVRETAEAKADC